mmetsp:Transcript_15884/g.23368  ORF Transcript_15884/g.23368 Transcript_15884/m.23368 type:complete len:374 (+) Transcript_15884:315-1436(+)
MLFILSTKGRFNLSNLSHVSTRLLSTTNDPRKWLVERFQCEEERLDRQLGIIFTYGKCVNVSEMEDRADWLQQRLKLNNPDLKKIVQTWPLIFSYESHDNLEPKLQYLQSRLKLSDLQLTSLIRRYPHIFTMNPDKLERKLLYLQQRLKLDDDSQIRKFIMESTSILNSSVQKNLEPKIIWIQKRLDLNDDEVSKIILKFPRILQISLKKKLEPMMDWLQQERLRLTDGQLRTFIRKSPQVLSYSIEQKIQPTLKWFQKNLDLKDDAEINTFVNKLPTLLDYSIKNNLEPTLEFYIESIGNKGDAITLLTKSPRAFGASLENRLKPRLDEAKEAGMVIDQRCLLRIATYTEKMWRANLEHRSKETFKVKIEET